MPLHPLAGQIAPPSALVSVPQLITQYYARQPDPARASERVSFGTSGHRGSSLRGSFQEGHVLAITQAIAEQRTQAGIQGPLFVGLDTHALSESAWCSALRVLIANGVEVRAQPGGYTPTPLVSCAILNHNRQGGDIADGIILTPSHNPPQDGGLKYNPPHGGPAETAITQWIERRANQLLSDGLSEVRMVPLALAQEALHPFDFITPYVQQLPEVIDLELIRSAGVRLGVDPLGGSSAAVWEAIAAAHQLDIEVVGAALDARFAFMPLDHDGQIRMDCSSPWAMAKLLSLKDRFDVAVGNDPDADRHGIVTPAGLLSPNLFLAVMVDYLFQHRPEWSRQAGVGKTVVSSALLDRVAAGLGRPLLEVPVGFKYFVPGLLDGSLAFGGEESAGASFARRDGHPWSTDKDGLIPGLLAAEILARSGLEPHAYAERLQERYGHSYALRQDAPITPEQRAAFTRLTPDDVTLTELAGEPLNAVLTQAPGNGAPIGGLKLVTASGWCALRPSGTEPLYKVYAESFKSEVHLYQVLEEAKALLDHLLKAVEA